MLQGQPAALHDAAGPRVAVRRGDVQRLALPRLELHGVAVLEDPDLRSTQGGR